ncbi:MAG: type II secretion system secretin GspD [Halioglobus sp.]|nr:type II secretion system secretin GspD [Halioglobus sp.]
MLRRLLVILWMGPLLSCAAPLDKEDSAGVAAAEGMPLVPETSQPAVDASAPLSTSAADLAERKEQTRRQPIIYRGDDQAVRMPARDAPVRLLGDDVSLNFEQAPLSEVLHAILGDILQLDYIIDQPVKGEVTLRTRTPIPRDQLMRVLESLLKANNALMVRNPNGRYLITAANADGRYTPRVSNPDSGAVGYSTVVVPLQYISAAGMARVLEPVAEDNSILMVDSTRNLLMLAGTREQLDGWLDLVATFDVDLLKGMSVGLFPLENSDVDEVAAGLDALLESGGDGEQAGPLTNLVRVVPVERLNSIMIVTPRSQYLDILGTWIERMDSAPDARWEKRLHVYPVQNTSATRLAALLNGIYADTTTTQTGGLTRRESGGPGAGIAPGMALESISDGGRVGSASPMGALPNATGEDIDVAAVSMTSDSGDIQSPLHGVRVVADDENNALMIYATGVQYDIIKDALEQLDVVATQVIIEASILEVTLTDELRYGLEWTFSNSLWDGKEGQGFLTQIGLNPGRVVPGFSYVVTNGAGNIKAVLNALSEESLVNVISTPSVMVLDNHTAYIHVGDQVPIIDQQSTSDASDTSRITQSVIYKDTGVQLAVTPSVNAGGLVTMDVEQSVTDVGPIDAATEQRTFLERSIMSKVAVRSNESVVLGGLIRQNATKGQSGIPFLHTVPVVGPLFGATAKDDRRTELLVIITPRALYSEDELRQVSKEMRARIRHMELIDVPES